MIDFGHAIATTPRLAQTGRFETFAPSAFAGNSESKAHFRTLAKPLFLQTSQFHAAGVST
jgi:hypothetical protein